ncbi:HD domain-containing protein [Bradyrhizobium brasilense]|uniref:HD domain-containing protein n=1 Tax=Bradyrhizobium brasilense TaxID=1419277 RepID=A0A1G6RXY8_9BRAD|nr:HD domain-containing protein [Bradyrhizobium brasilense]SDD09448.1 HD domain-containing protein [Bradyrhizobium brasilense]
MFELLVRLEDVTFPPGINQLEHSLQVATRARAAGAKPDLVLGALMHDVGRLIAPATHGLASAELLAPFVSPETYWVVRVHDEIMMQFVEPTPGLKTTVGKLAGEPWFPLARIFAEHWDRYGFVPDARPLPLEFFRPFVHDFCRR